jgi:hypothetical protein
MEKLYLIIGLFRKWQGKNAVLLTRYMKREGFFLSCRNQTIDDYQFCVEFRSCLVVFKISMVDVSCAKWFLILWEML